MAAEPVGTAQTGAGKVTIALGQVPEQGDFEAALWKDAQETLKTAGIKAALSKLLSASYTASSVRQKNRYRLMMANLALQAKRPDIARPILEELYALIGEFHLEEWESSLWIAEVIEAYFQCLTAEGSPDEDISKAYSELYPKLCSRDITKALLYKKGG